MRHAPFGSMPHKIRGEKQMVEKRISKTSDKVIGEIDRKPYRKLPLGIKREHTILSHEQCVKVFHEGYSKVKALEEKAQKDITLDDIRDVKDYINMIKDYYKQNIKRGVLSLQNDLRKTLQDYSQEIHDSFVDCKWAFDFRRAILFGKSKNDVIQKFVESSKKYFKILEAVIPDKGLDHNIEEINSNTKTEVIDITPVSFNDNTGSKGAVVTKKDIENYHNLSIKKKNLVDILVARKIEEYDNIGKSTVNQQKSRERIIQRVKDWEILDEKGRQKLAASAEMTVAELDNNFNEMKRKIGDFYQPRNLYDPRLNARLVEQWENFDEKEKEVFATERGSTVTELENGFNEVKKHVENALKDTTDIHENQTN
jgi:hypothetical protein